MQSAKEFPPTSGMDTRTEGVENGLPQIARLPRGLGDQQMARF